MNFIRLEKFYIFLFSIIPLSIIGPTISLLNILFLGLLFLVYAPYKNNNNLYKNPTFIILICIYFYLIFNSRLLISKKYAQKFWICEVCITFFYLSIFMFTNIKILTKF